MLGDSKGDWLVLEEKGNTCFEAVCKARAVYAKYTEGIIGASENIDFTIANQNPM